MRLFHTENMPLQQSIFKLWDSWNPYAIHNLQCILSNVCGVWHCTVCRRGQIF